MITTHDLFAGAGGSSTGAVTIPGVSVVVAAKQWQRALLLRRRLAAHKVDVL
jgi:DNA (cytosine-5)-methyltransferase 1